MVDLTVGHYRIREKFGGGGIGLVRKAENLRIGSLVVLKSQPEDICCSTWKRSKTCKA